METKPQLPVKLKRDETRKILQRCCGLVVAQAVLSDPSLQAVSQLAGFIAAKRILEGELAKSNNSLMNLVVAELAEQGVDMTKFAMLAFNYDNEEVVLSTREPGQ